MMDYEKEPEGISVIMLEKKMLYVQTALVIAILIMDICTIFFMLKFFRVIEQLDTMNFVTILQSLIERC